MTQSQTRPILALKDVDTFYGPVQAHFALSLHVCLLYTSDAADE